MKEEFVLPKYWYLKIEPDNIDLIQKWRKREFNFDDDISRWNYVYEIGEWDPGIGGVGWFVLSIEQFIKYVLKEETIEIKEDMSKIEEILIKLNIR